MQNHINCVVSELDGEEFSNYFVYVSGNTSVWLFMLHSISILAGAGGNSTFIFCRMCNAVSLATEFSLSGHETTEKTANCAC